jgi:hypothetical protein
MYLTYISAGERLHTEVQAGVNRSGGLAPRTAGA